MGVRWSNLVLLSALLACPSAVAPFLASWHWALDLLACFPVQAMAWLVLASAMMLLARRWWAAALLGLFAGFAAGAVLPAWLRSPPAGDANGPAVRMLALNLMRGNEAEAAAAIAVVRAHDPDVLFCSEVTTGWLAALTSALAHLPHRCVRASDGYFGVALFSRWPLLQSEVIPLGYEWAPAVRALVATPGGSLGVLGVHTPRPGDGEHCAERDHALSCLPAALASLPSPRVVLGDCNATPWNHAFHSMLAATGLRQATDGGWRPTWTTDLPWPLRIPIDHVLVSDRVGVATCAVGAEFGSDHLPLFAALRLSP